MRQAVQAVVQFAAIIMLIIMALGVAFGGLLLLDRFIMWLAGL